PFGSSHRTDGSEAYRAVRVARRAVIPFRSGGGHERDVDRRAEGAVAIRARPLREPARARFVRLRSNSGRGAPRYARMGRDPGPTHSRRLGLICKLVTMPLRVGFLICAALRKKGIAAKIIVAWGCSSAGRASRSQCEGREFDPPQLHHRPRI